MFLWNAKHRLHMTLAGEVYVPKPNEHFRRRPPEYILYLVTEGQMRLVDGEEEYLLTKGDVILLDPERTHYGLPTDSAVGYHYLHFETEGVRGVLLSDEETEQILLENRMEGKEEKLLLPKYLHLTRMEEEELIRLADRLQEEYQGKNLYYSEMADALLKSLLLLLARAYADHLTGTTKRSDLAVQLIEYIKMHSREHFSGEDLEREFHMNFDHMNRCFKKKTGYTILFYANRYRIEEAKSLLRSGYYNVSGTAQRMGFANEFYFSRVFKKYEGMTPSEYAKKIRV